MKTRRGYLSISLQPPSYMLYSVRLYLLLSMVPLTELVQTCDRLLFYLHEKIDMNM